MEVQFSSDLSVDKIESFSQEPQLQPVVSTSYLTQPAQSLEQPELQRQPATNQQPHEGFSQPKHLQQVKKRS